MRRDFAGPRYYDRKGRPLTLFEWADRFERWTKADRIVAQDRLRNGTWVSTVWLGIDHGWGEGHRPLIFETMAWAAGGRELGAWRYGTELEAQAGHAACLRAFQLSDNRRMPRRVLARKRARDARMQRRRRRRMESAQWYHFQRNHLRWIDAWQAHKLSPEEVSAALAGAGIDPEEATARIMDRVRQLRPAGDS